MPGLIQRRAQQIVHGGIDDHKIFFGPGLDVLHRAQQHARISRTRATRLQCHGEIAVSTLQDGENRLHIIFRIRGCLIGIPDTHPAAQIQM